MSINQQCERDLASDAAFDVVRTHRLGGRLIAECVVATEPHRRTTLDIAYGVIAT